MRTILFAAAFLDVFEHLYPLHQMMVLNRVVGVENGA